MNNSQATVILNKTDSDGFLHLDLSYELNEVIEALNRINRNKE